jgi:hypothetical protein
MQLIFRVMIHHPLFATDLHQFSCVVLLHQFIKIPKITHNTIQMLAVQCVQTESLQHATHVVPVA